MTKSILAAAVLFALLAGCKTTRSHPGYNHGTSHQPGVSDGPTWRDPGPVNRVRNAFASFMY